MSEDPRRPVETELAEEQGRPTERSLPFDPDLEADEGPRGEPLPVHLDWRFLLIVACGGLFGTAARYSIGEGVPPVGDVPAATLLVNLVGAFGLGVLLEGLALRGSDVGHRRTARLLLGTGFMGGFTTYSTFAVDTDTLLRAGHVGVAFGYALGTVVVGLFASLAGIALARRVAS